MDRYLKFHRLVKHLVRGFCLSISKENIFLGFSTSLRLYSLSQAFSLLEAFSTWGFSRSNILSHICNQTTYLHEWWLGNSKSLNCKNESQIYSLYCLRLELRNESKVGVTDACLLFFPFIVFVTAMHHLRYNFSLSRYIHTHTSNLP